MENANLLPSDLSQLVGHTVFQVGSSEEIIIVPKSSKDGFEILSTTGWEQELQVRIGDLTSLKLKGKDNDKEVLIEGSGVYTKNFAAL